MLNPTLQYSTANGAMVSDEALMEAITDHRPEALSEFYARHGGRLSLNGTRLKSAAATTAIRFSKPAWSDR